MKYFPEFEPSDKSKFIDLYREGFDRYCRQLADYYGCLNNQGLALLDDDADIDQDSAFIDDLFVLPSFGTSATSAENFDTAQQTLQAKDNISLAKLLAAKPRQFILGDPGIGKTTFLHWLAISLAHHRSNYVQQAMGPLLPILLRVRDFRAFLTVPNNTEQFLTNIRGYLGSLGELLDLDKLTEAMANGQVLLLVDGLDEIGKQEMLNLGQTLATLFSQYPSCRCIMTARVVGFDASLLWPFANMDKNQPLDLHELNEADKLNIQAKDELNPKLDNQNILKRKAEASQRHDFGLYYIQPLNNEQRLQFSQKWCKIYVKTSDAQAQFIDDLQAAFDGNDALNNLSRTPVLLNMICFIQQRRGRLPNGRAELYQKIIETYLVSMDRARGIKNNFIDSEDFDYTDIRNWLAKLAYAMQLGKLSELLGKIGNNNVQIENLYFDNEVSRVTSLTESELTRFFAKELEEVYEDKDTCQQTAQSLIDYIKLRTGFLIDRGQDAEQGHEAVFAFSHLSFQEYFAAHFISGQWSQLSCNSTLVNSLNISCNNQSWFECWQLVFEDYSQNGNSRQQHSQFIDKLFGPVDELDEKFPDRDDVFGDKVDHALHLLSKIILNPAVKLSPNYRQQQVTALWSYNFRQGNKGSASIYSLWPELCRDYNKEDSLSRKAIAAAFELYGHDNAVSLYLGGVQSADLRPLKLWSNLRELNISHTQVNTLLLLKDFNQLERLKFDNTQVLDLAPLTKLTELKSLSFSNNAVANLTPLAGLSKLVALNMHYTQVTDLTPLAGLQQLKFLMLHGTKVTDLSPIANLTQMDFLGCINTDIADLTPLAKLTDLTLLWLTNTHISDLTPLTNMPHLRHLEVANTPVSDLTPLANMPNLKILDIANTAVSDLTPLANMLNLQTLDVTNTAVSDLMPLENLTGLIHLYISHTQVSDLTPLAKLPSLEKVYARGCEQLDAVSLQNLPEHIKVHLD
ncbi:NACHT domain-containing protein [Shewanella baltica]|uniref:leucine-rich repeat domain-containing protein n=1 Tax=Shewanella baltica TaxID=62322 RepID=UPI002871B4DB|nr:leucine-rich repeat domain-containing protein [Shewanella baltica]MDR9765220.1 NACHT domain-containing protein [Shewanella baltica]